MIALAILAVGCGQKPTPVVSKQNIQLPKNWIHWQIQRPDKRLLMVDLPPQWKANVPIRNAVAGSDQFHDEFGNELSATMMIEPGQSVINGLLAIEPTSPGVQSDKFQYGPISRGEWVGESFVIHEQKDHYNIDRIAINVTNKRNLKTCSYSTRTGKPTLTPEEVFQISDSLHAL